MSDVTVLDIFEARLAQTRSIRGALFVLKNEFKAFGGCHLAYEFFIQETAYIRGDLVNVTTLPGELVSLYLPSGGTNSDPVIENISKLNEPLIVNLRDLCATQNTKFYRNPFFAALMDTGCTSLAAYPIPIDGAGYGALTIFETPAQRANTIDPAYFLETGKRFHNIIKMQGQLARYFGITEKERYVLEQMARGKITNDIAQKTGLTRRTVELRLQNVRKKLRARTTIEAVYKASVYAIITV